MSYNTWRMFQDILGVLFLPDVGYLPSFHFMLSFWYIIDFLLTLNLSVLAYIRLFIGTLKILKIGLLMMEYYSKYKTCVQQKKETCPFLQKAYIQIYYPQLLS